MTEQAVTIDADRIKRIAAGSERLYLGSFFGRSWLADYVADVDALVDLYDAQADELERLRAEVKDWKHGSGHEAEEVDRLHAELATWQQRQAALTNPDYCWGWPLGGTA